MEEKKTIEMTLQFEDPGLTDQQKQSLIDALKSEVVAVLEARSRGKVIKYPQFKTTP
jgi:hypothetical protein